MEISIERLNEIIERASTYGAHEALRLAGVPVQEYYTRAELSRKFGKGKINRMMKEHVLTPHKMGENGKIKYSIKQVLAQVL